MRTTKQTLLAAGAVALGLIVSTRPWDVHAAAPAAAPATIGATAKTTEVLSKPAGLDGAFNSSAKDLFDYLNKQHEITLRFDPVAFGKSAGFTNVYEKQISIPVTAGLTVRDILDELYEQVAGDAESVGRRPGYTVRGRQIIIGHGFLPPAIPGSYKAEGTPTMMVPVEKISDMLYGPKVHVAVVDKSLAEVVAMLREQTGANIVLDSRVKDTANKLVTLTVNDAKLFTVLKVAGDMCDLAPAVVDNVFYLTNPENAAVLIAETERNLFGVPLAPAKP